jgi:hypothetical protein
VEALKVKYAKEPKKIIKAEVASDKIMELRLRQAGRGQLAKTGESAYVDSVVRERKKKRERDEKRETFYVCVPKSRVRIHASTSFEYRSLFVFLFLA